MRQTVAELGLPDEEWPMHAERTHSPTNHAPPRPIAPPPRPNGGSSSPSGSPRPRRQIEHIDHVRGGQYLPVASGGTLRECSTGGSSLGTRIRQVRQSAASGCGCARAILIPPHCSSLAVVVFAVVAVALPRALASQQRVEGDRGTSIRLVRELAIGADLAGPEYEFSAVGGLAVAHSGSVYVAAYEGAAPQIRKFDVAGHYRGAVGRAGAGPAEYRSVDGIAVVGDSVLVIYDRLNGRVTVFDTLGAYRSSFRASSGSFWYNYFAVLSDGSIGVRARARAAGPAGELIGSVFVLYRLDGALVDSVAVPPEEPGGIAMADPSSGPRWAFPMTTVFAVLPGGGIATAHTSRYRVEVAPAHGRPFAIERNAGAIPLEGSEREEWEAVVRKTDPRARVTIPTHKPFMRSLLADADGRIWVDLYTRATRYPRSADPEIARRHTLTWEEHKAYDVFDQRLAYLGRLDLAPFTRMVAAQRNRVWVVEEAQSGFRLLVRYRMLFPAG